MIHIYCGDGKGKTTAAVGLAVRMAGFGGKVLLGQFFKDGSSSEIASLRSLTNITVRHCRTIPGRFVRLTPEQRIQVSADYTNYLTELLDNSVKYDMLILDEVVSACNHGTVPEGQLIDFLKKLPEGMEVVLTGRNPSPSLLELADYVTEMRKLRHPFDNGVPAREGIEF